MSFEEKTILHYLKKSRPDANDSTINSYNRLLTRLDKVFFDSKIHDNPDQLLDFENTLDKIKSMKVTYLTERNYINAIIVLLQGLETPTDAILPYQTHRDSLNKRYTDEQSTRELSQKQKDNWLSLEQLTTLLNHLKAQVKTYPATDSLDNNSLRNIQWYFMLSFWLEYPLRNDLNHTKVITKRQYNALGEDLKLENNYLVRDKIPFVSIARYKTVKTYGVKIIHIKEPEVKKALDRWLKSNPLEYILINIPKSGREFTPLSSIGITHSFNRLFQAYYKRNFSTSLFRHVVLTEKFGDTVTALDKYREIMGHSAETAQTIYIKKQ
jgi:hypothetical protein